MAIEDAEVFGTLFARLSREEQIQTFSNAFQEIREERTADIRLSDVSSAAWVRLPPGPERNRRDEMIRDAPHEWDDEALQREFEDIAPLFCYDATDAVDVCTLCSLIYIPSSFLLHHRNGGLTGAASKTGPTSRRRVALPFGR